MTVNEAPLTTEAGNAANASVVIVGGGPAGLLSAYMLSQAGSKCVRIVALVQEVDKIEM